MIDWFAKCKKYFDKGLWSIDNLKIFVEKEKITAKEYKEITGEDYV